MTSVSMRRRGEDMVVEGRELRGREEAREGQSRGAWGEGDIVQLTR